jgi:hypothetical protein
VVVVEAAEVALEAVEVRGIWNDPSNYMSRLAIDSRLFYSILVGRHTRNPPHGHRLSIAIIIPVLRNCLF